MALTFFNSEIWVVYYTGTYVQIIIFSVWFAVSHPQIDRQFDKKYSWVENLIRTCWLPYSRKNWTTQLILYGVELWGILTTSLE
jgi:hypothetical protein